MKLMKYTPTSLQRRLQSHKGLSIGFVIALILLTNVLTFYISKKAGWLGSNTAADTSSELVEYCEDMQEEIAAKNKELYLLDKAVPYVSDVDEFEKKVRQVSDRLSIPPEWLMAVIHAESQFDGSMTNGKASGSTGLIQWLPETAKQLNTTIAKIRNMNHVEQLELIEEYLQRQLLLGRKFDSLTDVYLSILFPYANSLQETILYTQPSIAYNMHMHLDIDKNDTINVQDIDQHLQQIYADAYPLKAEKIPFYTKMLSGWDFRDWWR